jgi:hypothetical protein
MRSGHARNRAKAPCRDWAIGRRQTAKALRQDRSKNFAGMNGGKNKAATAFAITAEFD